MKNSIVDVAVSVKKEGTKLVHTPIKICMHVRGVVRTDMRVLREATALIEAGFDVSIVDVETDIQYPRNENIADIHVKHLIKPEWLIPEPRKVMRAFKTVQKLMITTVRLYNVPATFYHAHDINALLPCYLAAMLRRKRLVYDAHEMPLYEFEQAGGSKINKLIMRFYLHVIRHAVAVITVSPAIIEEMAKRYSIDNITLVRNILPYQMAPVSDRLREQLKLGPEVRIVLYQGNLQPGRGLETLVKTARFLEENIIIVLMGKGCGTTPAELRTLIAQEGVMDRVKILPPVPYEELLSWTASADIGAITYSPDYSTNIYVQMPNKLFEYIMVGLPFLVSSLPAIVDILDKHDVGRVLPSLEPRVVAREINTMLTDTVRLAQMKRNALAVAQQTFCWEEESQQLIQLYHMLIKAESQHE